MYNLLGGLSLSIPFTHLYSVVRNSYRIRLARSLSEFSAEVADLLYKQGPMFELSMPSLNKVIRPLKSGSIVPIYTSKSRDRQTYMYIYIYVHLYIFIFMYLFIIFLQRAAFTGLVFSPSLTAWQSLSSMLCLQCVPLIPVCMGNPGVGSECFLGHGPEPPRRPLRVETMLVLGRQYVRMARMSHIASRDVQVKFMAPSCEQNQSLYHFPFCWALNYRSMYLQWGLLLPKAPLIRR